MLSPRASGHTTLTPVPLYWATYGPAGAPRLLVLHGGPGAHHDYLLPQMLELAREYELVFYDQRGGGRSRTDSRQSITWHTQVDDLALVVRELGLEPLTIIGYSWGGLLALLYAVEAFGKATLTRPARMVLIDPAPPTRAQRDAFQAEFARRQNAEPVPRMRQELAASGLRERDPAAYRQRLFELSVAGYFARPDRARDLTPFRVLERHQKSIWESLGEYDLLPALHVIDCPVLILHGREDPIPLTSSVAVRDAIPHAQLVVLDGSGHVPYVEAPHELFAAIRRFLDDTAPHPSSTR